jgi:hypothetical protein
VRQVAASILSDQAKQLLAIDRYEGRALSRRKSVRAVGVFEGFQGVAHGLARCRILATNDAQPVWKFFHRIQLFQG